ncbi:type VII secretion target [Mycobacterium sp.]|uniref:type VII secretion target n=1 Tax=Mycobacterium sp. TaxID=1785 RepID=UPI0031DFBD90
MLVNPELLRGFAREVDAASAKISGAHLGQKMSTAADGLPGSATQWAARLVGVRMTAVTAKIATNVADMGVAVRGAGDRYEVEDHSLAGTFDGLL